jgi:hypothetical protein
MNRTVPLAFVMLAVSLSACSGSSGGGVPTGMIALFDGECPDGWARYGHLDGRFPRGNSTAGETGGEDEHTHTFDITARTSKDGSHHHMLAMGEKVDIDKGTFGHIGIYKGYVQAFEERGRDRTGVPRARAVTDDDGSHDHLISVQGDSESTPNLPPYLDLVFCQKE